MVKICQSRQLISLYKVENKKEKVEDFKTAISSTVRSLSNSEKIEVSFGNETPKSEKNAIRLPDLNKINNKLNYKNDNYYINSFLTGFFATLLATPCTAPFLGTSVGFALTQDNYTIFLIFLCLSLGFSLPYFLLLFFQKTLLY